MFWNLVEKIGQKQKWFGIVAIGIILALVITAFPLHFTENGGYRLTIGNLVSAEATDYTCDGIDDDVTFQLALDALPAGGGELMVLAGVYVWDDAVTVTRAIDNVSIIGVGASTQFTGDNSTPIFTAGGDRWLFSSFQADAGSLAMGVTSDWTWLNIFIDGVLYSLESPDGSIGLVDDLEEDLSEHDLATTGVHDAGEDTLWHGGLTDIVDKTHLSQDFGASAIRLQNLVVVPIAGQILRILNAADSPFAGVINGNPTATSVIYDGDTREDMFKAMSTYTGSDYWGQIILHNTTRSNSRKIVSVDLVTNTITTSSSTDNWADDDVITVQSQINTETRYFDVDISDFVPATTSAIWMFAVMRDNEGNLDANRYICFHPFSTYTVSKRSMIVSNVANDQNSLIIPLQIIDQKFTMMIAVGCVDIVVWLAVLATVEYADE